MSLSEWAKAELKDSENNLEVFVGASLLQDNIFKTLYGTVSSAISVYDSYLSIRSYRWQNIDHFEDNISSEGTTIYGKIAAIMISRIKMRGNKSAKGGCL